MRRCFENDNVSLKCCSPVLYIISEGPYVPQDQDRDDFSDVRGSTDPTFPRLNKSGALRSTAQMVPYEVSVGLILIVRLVSVFGSAKAIARLFPYPNPGMAEEDHLTYNSLTELDPFGKPIRQNENCIDVPRLSPMKHDTHSLNAILSASLYRTLDAQSRGRRLGTFQTNPQMLRTARLGIEDPVETCIKYCSRVSSAGDVGRLCSFSGLVGKSRAYEDCILDVPSSGCVVRHTQHKPYLVQSEYVARTVDSKRGSVPCHYMIENSPMHLEMV
ncbi:hypothetical protein Sango_1060400 [Sesamum angolense]|uniref:Uncharacterized protein n=1 Tax=Sesamum angolense TaxID=2727404 RepID=A0AAE1X1S7_9LAMI|nr:hypothetical protein Sango_1060400 [Sesamum angolense]